MTEQMSFREYIDKFVRSGSDSSGSEDGDEDEKERKHTEIEGVFRIEDKKEMACYDHRAMIKIESSWHAVDDGVKKGNLVYVDDDNKIYKYEKIRSIEEDDTLSGKFGNNFYKENGWDAFKIGRIEEKNLRQRYDKGGKKTK